MHKRNKRENTRIFFLKFIIYVVNCGDAHEAFSSALEIIKKHTLNRSKMIFDA